MKFSSINTTPVRRIASVAFCTVALGCVLAIAIRDIDAIVALGEHANLWLSLVATLALMVAMSVFGAAVAINLRMLGYAISLADGCYAFFVSQIGKYVPGKVWLFAIRAQTYSRYGVSLRLCAVSMAIEIALYLGAALAIGLALAPFDVTVHGSLTPAVAVWSAIVLLGCASVPILNRVLVAWYPAEENDIGAVRVSYLHLSSLLACYCFGWLAVGAAFLLLAHAIAPVSIGVYPQLTSAFALACVGGYVVLLAPAGLGARELVLTGILTPSLGPGTAAALALLARCWWTLAELNWVGIALFVRWFRNRGDARPFKSKS